MSLFDSILGQLSGNVAIDAIATKFGIPPAMAEAAVAALTQAHPEPGDTVATAAANTGMDAGVMGQISDHIGGEDALGKLGGMLKDNPQIVSAIGGMMSGGQGAGLGGLLGGLMGGGKS